MSSRKLVDYLNTATARKTQAPWCLRESAWLLPPANPAPAHPWDRQPGSPAHRSRAHVVSAMRCRRPLALRPSAVRQIRPGPRPLSPTSPPCTHLTLVYSPILLEGWCSRTDLAIEALHISVPAADEKLAA